jgi:hypothetical protein
MAFSFLASGEFEVAHTTETCQKDAVLDLQIVNRRRLLMLQQQEPWKIADCARDRKRAPGLVWRARRPSPGAHRRVAHRRAFERSIHRIRRNAIGPPSLSASALPADAE